MIAQIVDPSLRPSDPEVTRPLRRRLGIGLLLAGIVIMVIGGFWGEMALWFSISGIILFFAGVFLLRRRPSEGEDDIRKLYGQH